MKTPQEIASELKQFYGLANLYKHSLGLNYTEGVQYLAEEANCYWLLDAIASHQTNQFLSNPKLREFQIWHLQVKDNSGVKSAVGSLPTASFTFWYANGIRIKKYYAKTLNIQIFR